MEVKKAIKKVVALGAGATMMGATLMGAVAADLADYPAPFVKNGQFDAFIVVGDQAAAEDVVGAVDIGASLQFEMREEEFVSTGTANVLVSDGVKIKGTGSEVLNYNESIGEVRDTTLDEEDMPVMLAEGRYSESEGATDNDENYVQELLLNNTNGITLHDQPDDLDHDDYLELLDDGPIYVYTLEFDDPVEFETSSSVDGSLDDDIEGTQIEIQGNLYTITDVKFENNANLSDMTLMAGDTLVWLMQDQVIEKTVNGVSHEIKVVDVTDNEDSCGVSVDGFVAWIDVKSDKTINGVNIGVLDAKAVHAQLQDVDICELNIGATEIDIENAEVDGFNSSNLGGSSITVDGMEIDDAEVGLVSEGDGKWGGIIIEFTPDDDVFLATDQEFIDPVLDNFKFLMGGVTTPREEIELKTSGSKDAELTFINNDGKKVEIPLYVNDAETGFGLGSDDDEPLLLEGDTFDCGTSLEDCDGVLLYALTSGDTAHVLEITNLDTDDTEVDLKDLTYGRNFDDKNYSSSISLGSLGSITLTDSGSGVITATNLDTNNNNYAETNYGGNLTLDSADALGGTVAANDTVTEVFLFTEDDTDDTDISAQTLNVTAQYDRSDDDELEISLTTTGVVFEPTGGVDESEDNSDVRYYTTLHGTIVEVDDEDDDYVTIMYPQEEVEINAFIAPTSAQITSSGGDISTMTLDKINVGAARLASEVDVGSENLILVGGACANAATAEAMDLPFNAAGCEGDLQSGEAIIKLVEHDTGKVSMVVAGMDAIDTRRATRVVSNYAAYDLSGSEARVTGTSLTDIKVSMPS